MWDYRYREVLEWLLHPHSIESFLDDFYEREVLHVSRNVPGYFGAYCDLSEAERVLSEERTAYNLAIYKEGKRVPNEAYTRKVQRHFGRGTPRQDLDVLDPHRVARLFASGCTLIYDHFGLASGRISKLMQRLEAFFGHRVDAALFLTPPNSSGFRAHWDTSDGFILQIEGRKRWRLCNPTLPLPLESQPHCDEAEGQFLMNVLMEPGDVLYLPRGTFHQAQAGDEHSLHVAIGLFPVRLVSVLQQALEHAAKRYLVLRRSAALPHDPTELQQLLSDVFSEPSLRMTLSRMHSQLRGEAADQHGDDTEGLFRQILRHAAGEDELVALRADALFEVIEVPESTVLRFSGNKVVLPKAAAAVIAQLRRRPAASVSDLRAYGPADEVVSTLIHMGLAVVLGPNSPSVSGATVTSAT